MTQLYSVPHIQWGITQSLGRNPATDLMGKRTLYKQIKGLSIKPLLRGVYSYPDVKKLFQLNQWLVDNPQGTYKGFLLAIASHENKNRGDS